jgi:hypothetical protein
MPTLDEQLAHPGVDPTTAMMIRAMAQAGSPGIAAVDRRTLQEVFGDVPLAQAPPTLAERLGAVASFAGNAILGRGGFGAAPFSKVMEGGKPKRVYRGTQAAYDVENPEKWDPGALFGPGAYHTESPGVASTYAQGVGNWDAKLEQAYADLAGWTQQRDWVRMGQAKEGDPKAFESALRWAEREMEDARTRIAMLERIAPNVRASYLDITKPLDIDAPLDPSGLAEIRRAAKTMGVHMSTARGPGRRGYPVTGDEVYAGLLQGAGGDRATVTRILQAAGYDGITHMGGGRAGRGKEMHRVWITLDPKREYPGFTPLRDLP